MKQPMAISDKIRESDGDISLQRRTLIEVVGERRVLIEHHRGVVAYGTGEIAVRADYGVVRICGTGLRVAKMTAEQLIICGCIHEVKLIRHGR